MKRCGSRSTESSGRAWAVVGASYASGVGLEELERQVRSARREALFSSATPRYGQPSREKQDAASGHSAITLGDGNGGIQTPHSAIAGLQFDRFLQGLVGIGGCRGHLRHAGAAERALLGPDDVLVSVDIGDMVSSDFGRVLETSPAGEAAARAMAGALVRFSADAADHALWKRQREARWHPPEPMIREVRLPSLRFVAPEAMRAQLSDLEGRQLDMDGLERRISHLYGDGDYERLRYSIARDGAEADLEIEAIEKSWGPTALRFGGGLASNLDGGGIVGLSAGLSRHWLNGWGARADIDLVLGTNNSLHAERYQALGLKSNWFAAPQIRFSTEAVPVYTSGIRLAEYRVRQRSVGLVLGYEPGPWGELRAGMHRGRVEADLLTGLPS